MECGGGELWLICVLTLSFFEKYQLEYEMKPAWPKKYVSWYIFSLWVC